MAGPYTGIIVSPSGTGISRAGFGFPVKAAIDDLHLRVAALEAHPNRSWSLKTSTNGTPTVSANNTPVRDAVLGNLTIPDLVTGFRYEVSWNGAVQSSAATATLVAVHIYMAAGTGTPPPVAAGDPGAVGYSLRRLDFAGVPETIYTNLSFKVPTNGTYTFAMYTSNPNATAVTLTPVSTRELLVKEVGPSPS